MSLQTDRLGRAAEIFCEVMGADPSAIHDGIAYSTYDSWDSLKHMEMVARFEDEFGLEIDIEDVIEMETVGRIKQILERYLAGDG